ncbi:Ribonucleases P/MRP protein subunit POP1 [Oopsacas minuta]|uniref:Ribonucleases P/MRP protein subunit POP1 n=1 Tax=Oopsacas minuta TaxID=111878 RepID=A0AAV7JTW1_9METZ|nr:Ribonucleases P/MRP protein subunit POP1 [Oopsacas minuta]
MAKSADKMEKDYLSGIPVWEFCCDRVQEITNMAEELNTGALKRKGRVTQSLPRHMRRRASSHNLRRLPVRVRLRAHAQSHPKQLGNKIKPKWCRKETRRKRRYLRSLRFQRMLAQFSEKIDKSVVNKSKWLPSHLWHAKRFHMIDKYSWKIPYTLTQKCTRHSYHSIAKKCAVIDTSYQSVFQISSDNTPLLIQTLNSLIIPSLSLCPSLQSLSPITTTLFYPDTYPYGAIGPGTFFPISPCSLWLLVHPAMVSEFVKVIDNFSEHIVCTDLTAEIGILQLVGPSSLSTLLKALPPDLNKELDTEVTGMWYDGFNYKSSELSAILEKISQSSNSYLPDNSLLGYTALDPRLSLPKRKLTVPVEEPEPDELMSLLLNLRNKLEGETDNIPTNTELVTDSNTTTTDILAIYKSHRQSLVSSQVYTADCRHQSVADKHTDDVINIHRGKCLYGLIPADPSFRKDRVPLWLLTTSGEHGPIGSTSQYGAGIILLLPREWIMTSLMALTYWGAKAVGKKEFDRVCLERQSMCYPRDCIDCYGYVIEAYNKRNELEKHYLSKPPDKRLEYGKMGVSTPFHSPWGSLMGREREDEQMDDDSIQFKLPYYILRDRKAILSLQHVLFKKHMPYKYMPRIYKQRYPCRKLPSLSEPISLSDISDRYSNSLLLISVHMLLRGCVEDRAKLFLPTVEDIQIILSSYSKDCVERDLNLFSIVGTNRMGVTKITSDRQLIHGISVHSEGVLKTARKSLKRSRKNLNKLPKDTLHEAPLSSCLYEPSTSSLDNLGMLALPANSRECCGYVTSGDYSFCRGYSVGIACVSLSSMLNLIHTQSKTRLPPFLLCRNPSATKLTPALIALIDHS